MSIILFLIILNIILFHSTFLGVILGMVYFFIYGKKLGRWLFSNFPLLAKERIEPATTPNFWCVWPALPARRIGGSDSRMGEVFPPRHNLSVEDCGDKWRVTLGIFFLLSFFSFAGAIIYYLYKLNNLIIIFLILAAPYIINKLYEKWSIPADATARAVAYKYSKLIHRIFFVIFNWGNLRNLFISKLGKFISPLDGGQGGVKPLMIAYLLIYLSLLTILFKSSTTDAFRSPWLIVPKYFFIIYIFATILLIAIILKNKKSSLPFIILHFFLSSSIALIVYKLSYGFDPFIHQATEKVIFEKGIITPKPFYYLGQYSIVVILAKIFQISVSTIDKLLVPILFSVFVPLFVFLGFLPFVRGGRIGSKKYAELSILALLILPFTSFIATTPQSLANVYALTVIFLSLSTAKGEVYKPRLQKYILIFLAATTLAIHPLTGIPVAIFIGLHIFLPRFTGCLKSVILSPQAKNPVAKCAKPPHQKFWCGGNSGILHYVQNDKAVLLDNLFSAGWGTLAPYPSIFPLTKGGLRGVSKIIQLILIISISSIIIPLTFYINSKISNSSQISISNAVMVKNFEPLRIRQFHFIRDFIYFYGFNSILIFLIFSIVGVIILISAFCGTKYPANNGESQIKKWFSQLASTPLPYLLTFLILIINYLILKNFVKFNSLIYYEQGDYAERLLMLSLYFLLPFFLYAFYSFFEKLFNHCRDEALPRLYRRMQFSMVFFLSFFALWITASLYLTYPRYDNYVSAHGFNVSETDFKAVEYIHKNATSKNYIVLANQNTSAAALAKYGFLKYYDTHTTPNNRIFYYPIPTSSPLYEYYLSMVNTKPSRKTMQSAMDYAGAEEAYFVVSDYWWKADQIIENAKLEADEWEKIDNGKIWVFKYK